MSKGLNYIKHLNAVFQQFSKDSGLNSTRISLYIAIFQFWNIWIFSICKTKRFPNKELFILFLC